MAFLFPQLAKETGIKPPSTRERPVTVKYSGTAATAETFDIDIPRDKFIWAILVAISESTAKSFQSAFLEDDIVDIKLVGNGNKYMKDFTGAMVKELCKVNLEPQSAGFYKVYLKDPKLQQTRPLPAWVFTSLVLKVTDNAPAATRFHAVKVSIVESDYAGEDLSNYPVLIEKYLKWKKYGTSTGWQEYEHERAYEIFGYLYCMDDNATLSNTIFNKIKAKGIHPSGEDILVDEEDIVVIREANKQAYLNQAMAAGFFMLEFPNGYDTSKYSSLYSYLNVPTAGTNASVRVVERYILT